MKTTFFLFLALFLAQSGIAANDASVVSLNAPVSVAPGANFTATITMTNSGDTTWTTAGSYNLGSENLRDNTRWGPSRVGLPTDPVNPVQTAAFTTTFTAPTTPGVYPFAWKMVQDGVESFGAVALTNIKVDADAQFTPGDLVVLQLGDGVNALATSGSPIFINSYAPTGGPVKFQVMLPTTGPTALIQGNNQFTGMIDLSTDRHLLIISGYNTNLPYSTTVEAAGSPVPRAVGTVDSAGKFTLQVTTTTAFNGGTFRGSVSDGVGNFWAGAQNGGIQYLGKNSSPVQISPAGAGAIRDLIMVNGSIAFSTSQFPTTGNHGVAVFAGAPTTPVEPVLVINTTAIPGATGTPSAKGFAINSTLTIAYVADVRSFATGGGIYRFNGTGTGTAGSWTYAYTLTNDLNPTATGVFQELAVDFSGANPKIYATTANTSSTGNFLVSATDTGAASSFSLLATAPALTAFRGLTFAPSAPPVIMSIARSGSTSW